MELPRIQNFSGRLWLWLALLLAVAAPSLFPGLSAAADGKSLPRSVVIATHAVGTGFHADGSVVAKVISERYEAIVSVAPLLR